MSASPNHHPRKALLENQAPGDPFVLFDHWFQEATAAGLPLPEAMTLATVTHDGGPAARVVLLKAVENGGFVFYTNYESRKGEELAENPYAALCFFWHELHEQVRVEGPCHPVSEEEGDAYFATRPRMSQIGAWASDQSQPLESRQTFEARLEQVEKRFEGQEVPRPPHWSGFRVRPERIEFWRGIENRLHERTLYWDDDGTWRKVLLYP